MPAHISPLNAYTAAALFIAGVGCMIAAGAINYEMAVRVNLKLPPDRQIREYGWYGTRLWRMWDLHRQFYPESDLPRRVVGLSIVGSVSFLLSVWRLSLLL